MKRPEAIHSGIVLRICTSGSNRCWIFDRDDGKVCCTVKGQMPLVGSYVHFYMSKNGNWGSVIYGIKIINIPFLLAEHNIYFLHHILELCYYFLSSNNPSTETFDLVCIVYELNPEQLNYRWIKVFLFKLLISFGSYSSHMPLSMQVFYWLSIESIDSIMNTSLHLEIERDMDSWLCSCVGAHPYFGDFKTVQFLTNLRVP